MKMVSIHAAIVIAAAVLFGLVPREAEAACADQSVSQLGNYIQYSGSCTEDDEVLVTTGAMGAYDACIIMSTTGAVEVFITLAGTSTYSTSPLSLQDFGAADTVPVLLTAALRVYGFVGKFDRIKVVQNGATDAAVVMNCWKL